MEVSGFKSHANHKKKKITSELSSINKSVTKAVTLSQDNTIEDQDEQNKNQEYLINDKDNDDLELYYDYPPGVNGNAKKQINYDVTAYKMPVK